MIIPKKVKIGGVDYEVRITDTWKDRCDDDGYVLNSPDEGNIIFIANDISQELQEITFLHEALHCMNTVIDHAFLDSFSSQIYQFLKDNKLIL